MIYKKTDLYSCGPHHMADSFTNYNNYSPEIKWTGDTIEERSTVFRYFDPTNDRHNELSSLDIKIIRILANLPDYYKRHKVKELDQELEYIKEQRNGQDLLSPSNFTSTTCIKRGDIKNSIKTGIAFKYEFGLKLIKMARFLGVRCEIVFNEKMSLEEASLSSDRGFVCSNMKSVASKKVKSKCIFRKNVKSVTFFTK